MRQQRIQKPIKKGRSPYRAKPTEVLPDIRTRRQRDRSAAERAAIQRELAELEQEIDDLLSEVD